MAESSQETVIGRITAVFGIKGWLKVYSFTDPRDGVLNYRNWTLVQDGKRIPAKLEEGRRQGQGIVIRLKGVDDRDVAQRYCGADILVPTEQLAELPKGDYYWYQLEGLEVFTVEDECLGIMHHMLETGANDVLVVQASPASIDQRERLIPYLPDEIVMQVDLANERMVVDWDPDF
ncbi:MAG: 16S rRNA processing protein RimM [Marinobacter psychrophilus]|jgi:16S rRNA processing protein RimM|uniref:ribosome maturation factor RimM n=1 Tax=Marinobacter psychrophilus TaxID=330734 RepID=UPI0039E51912